MNARMNASAKFKVRLTVNGELREFAVDPWRTLLEVLVEDFKLAKTKEGCQQRRKLDCIQYRPAAVQVRQHSCRGRRKSLCRDC